MRVFLTGGTGFIGSHVVMELLGRGDEVTILARDPSKIPAFQSMRGVRLVLGELSDAAQFLPAHDACIHNALIWEDELELGDTRSAIQIFQACADAGVEQLIYTSSTAVHRPFRPLMSEEDLVSSNDLYGATKLAGEAFLSAFSQQTSMRCNVIRPGPTVGVEAVPGGPVKGDRRFAEMVSLASSGGVVSVLPREGRQFIGVSDLARVYGAVLHSSGTREVYVVVAHNYTTWEEVAGFVVEACGSGSVVVKGEAWEPTLFDVGKIEREFGFAFDSTSAVRGYVGWLAGQP